MVIMTVSSKSENVMLRPVRMLRRRLRNALRATNCAMVMLSLREDCVRDHTTFVGENILRCAERGWPGRRQNGRGRERSLGSRIQQGFSSMPVLQRFNNSLTTAGGVLAYRANWFDVSVGGEQCRSCWPVPAVIEEASCEHVFT